MPVETKVCTTCDVPKTLDKFRTQKAGKFGVTAQCKSCESDYGKSRYKTLSTSNPELFWEKHLWVNHRTTPEAYYKRLAEQGGVCAICLKPPKKNGNKFRLSIDHDHACCPTVTSCGKCIRGLICHPCNVSLGLMQDDPSTFRRAALYLEK